MSKPNASEYTPQLTELVRATCLYVATRLGDLVDELVVIGGLVPSLIIPPRDDIEPHMGTMDLDVGLAVTLLDSGRYQEVAERLRSAGFKPDTNQKGNPSRQRWRIEDVTVDFLIAPTLADDRGGKLRDLEPDFAAIIAPGLELAFRDRQRVSMSGTTIRGETAHREIWVCGPGAYTVLKALAFASRGEEKDAYDLFYVLNNFGSGIEAVYRALAPLLTDPDAGKALDVLARDFAEANGIGPRRVAQFVSNGPNEALQADVVGAVRALLRLCGR